MAHVELAKAELSAIGGEIARLVGLFAGALALVLLALLLVIIGTTLFTAEWLLGSMGWGVIHGLLLFVGLAVAMVLAALGVSGRRLGGAFVVALVIGVLASVIFGLHLPNQAYTAIGDATLPNVEVGVRPLVVGAVLWAVLGLLVGSWAATKVSGAGTRIGVIIVVVLGGAAIGAFTAISFGVQAGVGLGMTIGYAAWIALMAIDVGRTGIDVEALQERFIPHRTMETTKETLEWLQSKMPGGTKS